MSLIKVRGGKGEGEGGREGEGRDITCTLSFFIFWFIGYDLSVIIDTH